MLPVAVHGINEVTLREVGISCASRAHMHMQDVILRVKNEIIIAICSFPFLDTNSLRVMQLELF